MRIRRVMLLAVAAMVLALAVAAGTALAAPSAKDVAIELLDFKFEPKSMTINAGDTVVWTNNGKVAHTVTASDGSWDSGPLEPGRTFSHKFDTAGTVPYYCKPHGSPDGTGMAATLVVQAASTGAAPAPAAPQQPAQATPSQPAAPAGGVTPSMDAMDQPMQNNTVTIHMVTAAQDGWMVIHTNTADNKPGPVIGHTAVKAGNTQDVKVTLSQTPAAGDKLWPMLHIDAGQTGVYEFPGADAPVIVNGDIVMKQITVQGSGGAAPAAPTPSALPNTGEPGPTSLWLAPLVLAVMLLLGGALLLAANGSGRR